MKAGLLAVVSAVLILSSCGQAARNNYMTDMNALMKADRDASAASAKQGMKAAMLGAMDDSCVLLRPNHPPLKGNDAKLLLNNAKDDAYTLTWEPTEGYVCASGEMAYTYGIYTLRMKADNSTSQGTYATIWKRDKDGKWKMMLDTGNEGLAKSATTVVDTTAH